jgi:hypothetical protein
MDGATTTALPQAATGRVLMKLNLKTAAAGAAIAVTAVLAASGTAAADYNACQAGKVCLFDGHDGTGDVLQLDGVDNPNVGQAWNDRASSLWNRTDKYVCVWTDANYGGNNWIIEPGQKQELLFFWDNAVTSIEVHYGRGCGG